MAKEKNYGMLAAIDWNSNQWQGASTKEDLEHSNFGFVIDNGITFTCLNFGHEIYHKDAQGYYSGLLPHTYTKQPNKENSEYVKVVFMKSKNWHDGNIYIVGLYAFPILVKGKKKSPLSEIQYDFDTNIKSFPKHIYLLKNPLNLSSFSYIEKLLPKDKELGKMGFNYLTKANVLKILDTIDDLNPQDSKLKAIKFEVLKAIENI